MSEETEKLLDKIDDLNKKLQKKDVGKGVAGFLSSIQKMFDNMDPDDKKTVRNRFNTKMSRFRQRQKDLILGHTDANKTSARAIKRRGGGIAKRGMGIAK
jgi:hypothetical protein